MSYLDEAFLPHLRLTMLRLLEQAPNYSTNSSVLTDAARAMGLAATRDQIRTELAWLGEQRLVVLTHPTGTLDVACLTARGADVASGFATVPGVQRPGPAS